MHNVESFLANSIALPETTHSLKAIEGTNLWLFKIPYANVLHEQLRIVQKAKSLVNPLNAFFPAY